MPGRFVSSSWVGVTLLVVLGFSSAARAQAVDDGSRAVARSLGTTGVEAYRAGDYATANDKLDKAYQILQAPSLGLWSARALVKLNRLVKAAERYREVTRLPVSSGDTAVQKQARSMASPFGPKVSAPSRSSLRWLRRLRPPTTETARATVTFTPRKC
jgi:hypothetical protein